MTTRRTFMAAAPPRRPRSTTPRCLFVAVLLGALLSTSASAHESRPAYLEITETAPGRYEVLWRTPVLSGMWLPVAFPTPPATPWSPRGGHSRTRWSSAG